MMPRLNAVDSPEQWIVLARSAVPVACPADTTEDVLAAITVPGNVMGPNGILRISVYFTFTNNANTKTPRVRWGGIAGTALIANSFTTNAGLQAVLGIANKNALNAQKQLDMGAAISSAGLISINNSVAQTAALDTSLAQQLLITGQKQVGGDTLTLESYLVELLQGA